MEAVVRGVNISLTPVEVLDLFSTVGVTSVYICSKMVDGSRRATESVIVTFVGHSRPT